MAGRSMRMLDIQLRRDQTHWCRWIRWSGSLYGAVQCPRRLVLWEIGEPTPVCYDEDVRVGFLLPFLRANEEDG